MGNNVLQVVVVEVWEDKIIQILGMILIPSIREQLLLLATHPSEEEVRIDSDPVQHHVGDRAETRTREITTARTTVLPATIPTTIIIVVESHKITQIVST